MLLRFQEANDAAANALLKTLEEAPSYAVLILTAESSEGLLPTIVSRCEVLRLHPVALESIQRLLEQKGRRRRSKPACWRTSVKDARARRSPCWPTRLR